MPKRSNIVGKLGEVVKYLKVDSDVPHFSFPSSRREFYHFFLQKKIEPFIFQGFEFFDILSSRKKDKKVEMKFFLYKI